MLVIGNIKKYNLEIVVFICGAVVMIFELIGSRIVAPYVGTSTYVWTSLIGIILASLSAGYYYGGRFADNKPNIKPLALIIFASAVAVIFSALIKDAVSLTVSAFSFSIEIKSILISIILFAPASFLLGMVSPYAVRLRMKDVEKAGGTSGNLYAISTSGSIVGTFLAGFYLIPKFGSFFSLILLSSILFLTSFFLSRYDFLAFMRRYIKRLFLLLSFFLLIYYGISSAFRHTGIMADIDTEYNRILISKGVDRVTNKPIVSLSTDPFGAQASIFTDGTDDLVFSYMNFFKMVEFIKPNTTHALMLGGGAYIYPRDFLKNLPMANIDVVEIDPGMMTSAKKYFGLKDDKRMNIIHEDGRIFLNSNKKKYDVIFVDVFNSSFSTPFQLTTVESIKKKFDALKDDGVVFVNLVSALEGERGKFFRAEYATYKKFFPNVYVFALHSPSGQANQNIILLATKSEKTIGFTGDNSNPLLAGYAEKLWTRPISNDVQVLTDDFAPVDYYRRISISSGN